MPRDDGEEQGAPEVPPEPFELFQSHKESLDRLYEWEKRLYEEVRVRAPWPAPLIHLSISCAETDQ